MSALGKRIEQENETADRHFDNAVSDQQNPPEPEAPPRERVFQASTAVLMRLSALADEQVAAKKLVEERWIADLTQFHGKYDADTKKKIIDSGGSQLFANQTRPKTTAWAARFGDMLFPTDDKNWGIGPTPVPSMAGGDASVMAMAATRAATEASARGDKAAEAQNVQQAEQAASQHKQQASEKEEADKRCEAMSKLLEDQLGECNYNIASREVILDACKLGTGILKGPVLGVKTRRSWQQQAIDGIKSAFRIRQAEDPRPGYVRVDPWNFFPDQSVAKIEDAEFTFERHLPTKRELQQWRKKPGFIANGIDQLLAHDPRGNRPDYFNRLRAVTETDLSVLDKNYLVWEYHGAVKKEELMALALSVGGEKDITLAAIVKDLPGDDVQAVIWFAEGGILLRYGLHPMESGDTLYSVFNFDKDETSIWGYGVPFLMRDPQAAFSAAWRMMMDNGALSSGPQIVINKKNIVPENGSWKLEPRKVWYRVNEAMQNTQPDFQVEQIECKQSDLVNILTTGKTFIDDETLLPPIAYGESGSHITKTAQGISMLMNAVNVIFRFVVKNWDDQMTVPNIQRLYDWNMQFHANDNVKGDFDVQARGSSVLLVREIQSQNLMTLAGNFSTHPIFGPMIKMLPLFRKLVASFLITPDEVVKDQDTYEKDVKAAADAAEKALDPKTKGALAIEDARHQHKMREMQVQARLTMMEMAAKGNIDMDALKVQLDHAERMVMVEAALTPADSKGGGGTL